MVRRCVLLVVCQLLLVGCSLFSSGSAGSPGPLSQSVDKAADLQDIASRIEEIEALPPEERGPALEGLREELEAEGKYEEAKAVGDRIDLIGQGAVKTGNPYGILIGGLLSLGAYMYVRGKKPKKRRRRHG